MFLLAALRENEAQPHLLWAGGGQQPLTTLQRPVSPSPSRGLLPWMSSPVLSRVRHTARGLGPTLNPGRAHLKIFSLIPSEKSLLQMRSCSQAPGTVFWRDHHSTCDIHQNGAIKFLNPTSALHLVSSDPWAAPFLGTPSLGLQHRPPRSGSPLAPSTPHAAFLIWGKITAVSRLFRSKILAVALTPLPCPHPIQQEVPWAPSSGKTQNPLTSHHLHLNPPCLSLDTMQAS